MQMHSLSVASPLIANSCGQIY